MLDETNRFLEAQAPWKTAKEDLPLAGDVLHVSLEVLRCAGLLLLPVMPEKMNELLERLSVSNRDFASANVFGIVKGVAITKGEPLFPRLDSKLEN